MAVLCPRCDVEPATGAAGEPCPTCGGKLIAIAETEVTDPLIGTTIDGRFAIVARLGRGGMGTVYRARQTSMDREVALKMIDRDLERDPAAVKRFFREAQLASQLAHPNTVSVIEFGQDAGGRVYLVMELLRGETLSAVLRRDGALSLERVVRIGVQMCDALGAALALGIVHRDLKPDNVIVLDGGRDLVKVLDFGLARSLVDPGSAITAVGIIAGTPRYLAPEVALRGAAPAPAQDIYALGVLLGELATGRELWVADTLEQLFYQKAEGTMTLAGAPAPLDALIRAMTAVDPTARPDASGVRAELLALDPARTATPARTPGPGAAALALGAAVRPGNAAGAWVGPGDPIDIAAAAAGSLATEPTAAAFEQIRPSRLVPIDEVPRAAPPRAKGPFGGGLDLPPGGPPVDDAAAAPGTGVPPEIAEPAALEIDADWTAARAVKQAAHAAPPPPPPPKGVRTAVGALIALAVIVGGTMYVVGHGLHHGGPPAPPPEPPRPTVGIRIVAPSPVDVRIDGARAGKTPLTLSYKRGGAPVMITADIDGHPVTRQVSPDRDQTIDLGADAP